MAWPTYTDVAARTGLDIETAAPNAGKIVYTDVSQYGVLDVTDLLDRAKAFCAAYCHRTPEYGFDESSVVETHDGGTIIQISHPPIVSAPTVEWDGTELTVDSDFYWYKKGYLYISTKEPETLESYKRYTRTRQVVAITYTGGYSDTESGTHIDIPMELKDIVLDVACRWTLKYDEQYRRDYGATQAKIGEWSVKFDETWLNTIYERLQAGNWFVAGVA